MPLCRNEIGENKQLGTEMMTVSGIEIELPVMWYRKVTYYYVEQLKPDVGWVPVTRPRYSWGSAETTRKEVTSRWWPDIPNRVVEREHIIYKEILSTEPLEYKEKFVLEDAEYLVQADMLPARFLTDS